MIRLRVDDSGSIHVSAEDSRAIPLKVDDYPVIGLGVTDAPVILGVGTDSAVKIGVTESFVTYDAPEYTGTYRVTPSDSEQTLPTAGRLMLQNVIVDAAQGSRLMENEYVEPETTPISVMPEDGYDGMKKVTVGAIPYREVDNEYGGVTVIIG